MSDAQNLAPAPTSTEEGKRKPYHIEFSEKIVAQLEAGTAPWLRPWHPGSANLAPHNPVSGTVYRGINRLGLSMSGHDDSRWMTFKQAKDQGYSILAGSKSEPVVFYQWTKEQTLKDEKGKPLLDKDGNKCFLAPMFVNLVLHNQHISMKFFPVFVHPNLIKSQLAAGRLAGIILVVILSGNSLIASI